MKLVVDDKIPHIAEFFANCDEIVYLPGELITRADLLDADILLTRTVTTVDEKLLANTSVKFVGTATTGTDHINKDYLAEKNITLATAAGANTQAVVEYIICCLAALKKEKWLEEKKVAGIIGCGRIGRIVAKLFQTLGFEVVCYDPLLTEKLHFNFVSLEKLISDADIISIHTPLTKTGAHPTLHLLDEKLLKKIKPDAILINTARGGVIDQSALLHTKNITLCLDVWEFEPHISLELLNKVFIGTPHIAGYNVQAKYRATEMMHEAAAAFFGWKQLSTGKIIAADQCCADFLHEKNWEKIALSHYNPLAHTQSFRDAFVLCTTVKDIEATFIQERKKYPLRQISTTSSH